MKNHTTVNQRQLNEQSMQRLQYSQQKPTKSTIQLNRDIKQSHKFIGVENQKNENVKNGDGTNQVIKRNNKRDNKIDQQNKKLVFQDILPKNTIGCRLVQQQQQLDNNKCNNYHKQQCRNNTNLMFFNTCNSITSLNSKQQPKPTTLSPTNQGESSQPTLKVRKKSQNNEIDFQQSTSSLSHSRSHELFEKFCPHSNFQSENNIDHINEPQLNSYKFASFKESMYENNDYQSYRSPVRNISLFNSKINSKCNSESSYYSTPSKSQQNCLNSPPHSIKQAMIPYSQYYQFYQKATYLQQQNWSLHSKLSQYENKILSLKKDEKINQQHFQQKVYHSQVKLNQNLLEIAEYEKKLKMVEMELEDQKQRYEELKEKIVQSKVKYLEKEEEIQQLSQQMKLREQSYTKNMSILNTQKQSVLKYYKSQCAMLKQQYEQLIAILKNELKDQQTKVQKYVTEIEQKNAMIQQISNNYDEVMNCLENACDEKEQFFHILMKNQKEESRGIKQNEMYLNESGSITINNDSNIHLVYKGQLQKIKQKHIKQREEKNRKIIQLEIEKQVLIKELNKISQKVDGIDQKQESEQNQKSKLAETLLRKSKSENGIKISQEIQGQLDYLRKELVRGRVQTEQKDQVMNKMKKQLTDKKQCKKSKDKQFKCGKMRETNEHNKQMDNQKQSNSMSWGIDLNGIKQQSNKITSVQEMQGREQKNVRLIFTYQNINFKHSQSSRKNRNFVIKILPSLTMTLGNKSSVMGSKKQQKKQLQLQIKIQQYINQFQKMLVDCQQILDSNQNKIKQCQQKVEEHLEIANNKKINRQLLSNQSENCQKMKKIYVERKIISGTHIHGNKIKNHEIANYKKKTINRICYT